jgi:ABC-type lipoprotein release transport system permease subunit
LNLVLRLAWRNLWRQPRRTWLTTGAMVFSNTLLVFMISLQFGMYGLMIDNTLQAFTGHLQVQAPGYIDDQKMRQTVGGIVPLAAKLRGEFPEQHVAARATGFALISSEDRSYGVAVVGVQPAFERSVSTLPGLVSAGRYLEDNAAAEIIIGAALARNLRVDVGDELTLLGSGKDGSFAAAVVTIAGIFDSGMADFDRSITEIPLGLFDDVFYMNGSGHHIVFNNGGIDGVAELKAMIEDQGRHEQCVLHVRHPRHPGCIQRAQYPVDVGTGAHPRVRDRDVAGPDPGTPGQARPPRDHDHGRDGPCTRRNSRGIADPVAEL